MTPLVLYWVLVIAFCIVMYVILDGFTLGIGMMLPFLPENERDIAVSVVLPTWDGNQTWLVLGSAALYGAFANAFALLLPALYLPILVMVLGLLFRGVSFEFRMKDVKHKHLWNNVFFVSSVVVTLVQGVMLAGFIQGYAHTRDNTELLHMTLTPFTLLTAIGLLFGYCLLGATRLIKKTMGKTRHHMYHVAYLMLLGVGVMMAVVSMYTPFAHPAIAARWFNHQHWHYLIWLPAATGIIFLYLLWQLRLKENDNQPFWCAVLLFVCPYLGFLISIFPYIVPYKMTIAQAASPHSALVFLSVGVTILLPTLIFYTVYSYRIFKGKVTEAVSY